MKKLFFLNEEEKERILNMHKNATKNHYLIENNDNQELLDEQLWKEVLKRGKRLFGGIKSHYAIDLIKKLKTTGKMTEGGIIVFIKKGQNNTEYLIKKVHLENEIDNLFKDNKVSDLDINELITKLKENGDIIDNPNDFIKNYDITKNLENKEIIKRQQNNKFKNKSAESKLNHPETTDLDNLLYTPGKKAISKVKSEVLGNKWTWYGALAIGTWQGIITFAVDKVVKPIAIGTVENNLGQVFDTTTPDKFIPKACKFINDSIDKDQTIDISDLNNLITYAESDDTNQFSRIKSYINNTDIKLLLNSIKKYNISNKKCFFNVLNEAFPYYRLSFWDTRVDNFTKYVMNPFKERLNKKENKDIINQTTNENKFTNFFEALDTAKIDSVKQIPKLPETNKNLLSTEGKLISELVDLQSIKYQIKNNCPCRFANLINTSGAPAAKIEYFVYWDWQADNSYGIAFTNTNSDEYITAGCGTIKKDEYNTLITNYLDLSTKKEQEKYAENELLKALEKLRKGTDINCDNNINLFKSK
jgi:hypothetical protein